MRNLRSEVSFSVSPKQLWPRVAPLSSSVEGGFYLHSMALSSPPSLLFPTSPALHASPPLAAFPWPAPTACSLTLLF